MPQKIAVLASGGLDSAVLIAQASKKYSAVFPIYVRNGHGWERAEIFWLKKFLKKAHNPKIKPLSILNVPTNDLYGTHWSFTGKNIPGLKSDDKKVYLPGKNLLLISKAAVFCALNKISNLALGPLKSNPFPDAKPEFFEQMEQAIKTSLNFKIKIHTPFLKKSKKEVVALGKKLPLHLTFSCLSPRKNRHCGKCNKCAERKKVFKCLDRP